MPYGFLILSLRGCSRSEIKKINKFVFIRFAFLWIFMISIRYPEDLRNLVEFECENLLQLNEVESSYL